MSDFVFGVLGILFTVWLYQGEPSIAALSHDAVVKALQERLK